ncbi:MAG: IS110 family transposase [Burkholderiales bacterium]|nr:IS110 family transposase [Burkholderiales bacterium]
MNVTPKASEAVTVAIDLAKEVFQLSFADASLRVLAHKRLSRSAFAREFDNRVPLHAVMEACGSAHYWARRLQRLGHRVTLLPAHQVRPYVLRRKTDRTDADGLLEALRCEGLRPVPVKTPQQQGIQGLHRIREHHKAQRTAAINAMRGLLREFGITIPAGAAKVRPAVLAALEDGDNDLPMALRHAIAGLLEQVAGHTAAMQAIEASLAEFNARDTCSQRLQQAGGVGLLTATALSASLGEVDRFTSGRHFASYLGLAPREHSSGNRRKLGRITKRGDTYLRTLLIHGARANLRSALLARKRGTELNRTQTWALQLAERVGHNKAAVALANKTARRLWAAEHHRRAFDPNQISLGPATAAH